MTYSHLRSKSLKFNSQSKQIHATAPPSTTHRYLTHRFLPFFHPTSLPTGHLLASRELLKMFVKCLLNEWTVPVNDGVGSALNIVGKDFGFCSVGWKTNAFWPFIIFFFSKSSSWSCFWSWSSSFFWLDDNFQFPCRWWTSLAVCCSAISE